MSIEAWSREFGLVTNDTHTQLSSSAARVGESILCSYDYATRRC